MLMSTGFIIDILDIKHTEIPRLCGANIASEAYGVHAQRLFPYLCFLSLCD